jgi:hypothetical protein
MFIVSGKLLPGITMEKAEQSIWEELDKLIGESIHDRELEKLKNKIESTTVFEEIGVLNKAMNLASFELLGDAAMINQEVEKYQKIISEELTEHAKVLFRKENSSTLRYFAEQ